MIHWAMTCTPNREVETVRQVLSSLMDAGVRDVRLFLDDGKLGCKMNYHRAITSLLQNAHEWDHIAALQDDMIPCHDLLRILGPAPSRVASMFAPHHNVRHCDGQRGWVDLNPGWGGWGTQFLIPVHVLRDILRHEFYLEHLANVNDQRHTDACMWETMQRMGVSVVTHIPSLFDHIGFHSTIGNIHGEDTRGYKFDEWQAPTT